LNHRPKPWSRRTAAALLALSNVAPSPLAYAAPSAEGEPVATAAMDAAAAPAPEKTVVPNRRRPNVTPPRTTVSFSAAPTAAEITEARIFGEPLLPVGGVPDASENQALASALLAFVASGREDTGVVEEFLESHPASVWRPSLLANLGVVYRRQGYFTRAMGAWEEAWHLSKGATDPAQRVVADVAIGNLLEWNAQFGRAEALEILLGEVRGRPIEGPAGEKAHWAREALWVLRNRHQDAIPSGPMALDRLMRHGQPGRAPDPNILAVHATPQGSSLLEMRDLSRKAGLNLKMVFREGRAAIPVPSVVHLRTGHFTAVVRATDTHYLLDDPILGGVITVRREALDAEASGYMLVAADAAVDAAVWREVGDEEGKQPRGKCAPCNPSWDDQRSCDETAGGDGGCGAGGVCKDGGMATYTFHKLLASLTITDQPIGYSPPRGPDARFRVRYLQREAFQVSSPYYSNLGPRWVHDWLSWVEANVGGPDQAAHVILRGGGREAYPAFVDYDPATMTHGPHGASQALLVRSSSSPIVYERRLPDGSKEVFAQWDGGNRFFLTQIVDAAGNGLTLTYDASFRIAAATDAIGQVTSFSYEHPTDTRKITKVTDPFGRSASFAYDSYGRLIKITDVLGMTSTFDYGTDIVRAMRTPYGVTTFAWGQNGYDRWLEATDPLLAKERLEFTWDASIPSSDPVASVPTGFEAHNTALDQGVTFFWGKRVMALFPGDQAKARQTQWMYVEDGSKLRGVPHTEKLPLEGRVWHAYPGQSLPSRVGSIHRPSATARVLDDGVTQKRQSEYNSRGLRTKEIDPLGRETLYVYGTNNVPDADPATGTGIDLLQVKQKNGSSYDILQSSTYNAQHETLTATDAAGQTTSYTYTAQGQVQTVTTPVRAGITENRTTTYAYDGDGYLQSITGPATGATTSTTYDDHGRVRTTTDADGYTVTYDYDAMDRPTKVTYPDGTYEQTVYNRLDAEARRDRLGRWSHTFHDALRRVVGTRDAAGRSVVQQWCSCGSLDKVIDASGNATTWERDLQGRVIREVRADGSDKEYVYEATTGRLKKVTDAKGQETHYSYFPDDNLQQISYTSAEIATPAVVFAYDTVDGRLATMTDGTGTTTYAYHPVATPPGLGAGQLASVDGPLANDTIGYAYDELGRVTSRTLNGVATTWAYDALGRLTTLTDPIGSFAYGYAGTTGRVTSLGYPNGQTTSYAYLAVNQDLRVQTIQHKKPDASNLNKFDYTYDAVGNIKTWAQQADANPAQAYSFEYDRADQLTAATLAAAMPKRYRYAYDPAGNRTVEQIDDLATLSTHDSMNRLLTQVPGGALAFRGTLSEAATVTIAGKPAAVTGSNAFSGTAPVPAGTSQVTVQATDAAGNVRTNVYQVTQTGPTKTFTYDPNGNLTGDGSKTYEWDAANRLTAVKQGGSTLASFTYDGNGRRATKTASGTTTTYVYDGAQFLEERPSAGATKRHVYGPGIDQPLAQVSGGATTYSVADHLGSVVRATDQAGAPTLTREYDPWGNPLQGSATSGFAFTGREWDAEVQLAYYRARYYEPRIGRFINEDPVRILGGLNLYGYVRNNPVNLVDAFGLAPGDKRYGLPDAFWRWAHRHAMGPYDLTKEEAEELYREWKRLGKPGPDGKGRHRPRDRGPEGGGFRRGGGFGRGGGALCVILTILDAIEYAEEQQYCSENPCECQDWEHCIT
jgi:RHS repeat-associated protein